MLCARHLTRAIFMAVRTSIFDRYAEQRFAREAREREQALAAEAAAAALGCLCLFQSLP
jgi:hypothetical protein